MYQPKALLWMIGVIISLVVITAFSILAPVTALSSSATLVPTEKPVSTNTPEISTPTLTSTASAVV